MIGRFFDALWDINDWLMLSIVSALLLSGCSLAPSDEVMKALAGNERSWCISVTSVYGAIRAGGSGIQGGTMVCTQEGLTVKDDASRITVPITISPSVTVSPSAPVAPKVVPQSAPAPPSRLDAAMDAVYKAAWIKKETP